MLLLTIITSPQRGILLIRNLPDLPRVENRLRYYETGRSLSAESEKLLNQFCRHNFGIELIVEFPWPENFDKLPLDERSEIEDWAEEFEANFETSGVSAEDAVVILRKYKVDFRDESGWPLLCTPHLMRPVEAAAKGMMGGALPNPADVELVKWEASLKRDAASFKPN